MSFMITMSQKELHRLEVIQKIRDERLSVVEAAERLDLSRSQVHRLLQAYYRDGPAGMVEIWLYLCLAALGYCYPTNRYRLPSKRRFQGQLDMAKLLANAIRSNTVNKLKGNFYDMDYHRIRQQLPPVSVAVNSRISVYSYDSERHRPCRRGT